MDSIKAVAENFFKKEREKQEIFSRCIEYAISEK